MDSELKYTPSFYLSALAEKLTSNKLVGMDHVDVCIVGGGIAGLSCAQTLIEAGYDVAVIEARRVFSGASGLNGGFVSAGYALSIPDIEKKVGRTTTKALFNLSRTGVNRIRQNISTYAIKSSSKEDGRIRLMRYFPSREELATPADMMREFEYEIRPVDQGWLERHLSSRKYKHGFFEPAAFHINPLNYGVRMFSELQKNGLKVIEGVKVSSIRRTDDQYLVSSSSGSISADNVVICTGGYTSGESKKLKRSILPITTYVAVTEPNDELPEQHIQTSYGLGDNRRASDYYRIVNQNQLLWGGRITAFPTERLEKITDLIRADIYKSYPKIKTLKIQTAWSGIMGYAVHKMPYVGRMDSGIYYCTAFGGHGLNTGTACGDVIAKAIIGNNNTIELFKQFSLKNNFGFLGKIAVECTYKKYIFGDHIRESNAFAKFYGRSL
jgi:gamma-glutamylputrescine oxidase